MRYVGIDPSLTRTGLCIIDGDNIFTTHLKSDAKKGMYQRQRHLTTKVVEYLKRDDVVILEDFGVSARFAPSGKFVERIELCGMIKLTAPSVTRLPWLSIAPTMLKSFATGKASSHKSEVQSEVKRRWGVETICDDEADAFVLARYAKAMLEREEEHIRKQKKFEAYGCNREHLARIRFVWPAICNRIENCA